MHARHPIRLFLLVAALAAQLWLAGAHAFEHPATQAEPLCQLCLHAPSLDHGAVPPAELPALNALRWLTAQHERAIAPALSRRPALHPIRGPPALR